MSIVICAISNNKEFVIAADKRAINNGITSDNHKKILQLRHGIFYGMTGVAEIGKNFFEMMLKPRMHLSSKELISFVDHEFMPMTKELTMTIAGKDEEDNFFLWQKNHEGVISNPQTKEGLLVYGIASNEKTAAICGDYFLMKCQIVPVVEAAGLTIRYAASKDGTISQGFDLYAMSR